MTGTVKPGTGSYRRLIRNLRTAADKGDHSLYPVKWEQRCGGPGRCPVCAAKEDAELLRQNHRFADRVKI